MIGAEDQRRTNEIARTEAARRPLFLQRLVDRVGQLGGLRRHAREQIEDSPAGLCDGVRAEIVRERIARGDDRKDGCAAIDEW